MRDDSRKWDAPPDDSQPLTGMGMTVARVWPTRQLLISAPDVLARMPGAGWPDVVTGAPYTLCLRRDRVLEVDGPAREEGWDGVQAVTDVSDAYAVFRIEGPQALALCRRGTEVSLARPSRSVARQMFGLSAFLYPWENEERFCLHVPRAHAQALWQMLAAHMGQMQRSA
ncbi:hypothetical protein [Antarcticimicrobium luteum]|uniref:Sarcosine oxidase subunit gamma n=1 Tax=Antarcticimicrobium luteum TaxID=2547397 RepID=A0A4R5VDY7_9RHOB|nr:hypothetical protein [Antarcticimicrobium luteum]TDK50560.1 hypothetical protein E1832_05955 [Antarcticimicrobium luteum]